MNLVNGLESDTVSVNDRGLMYGDGVFRTLTLRAGKPLLWLRQYAKLAHDCRALCITCPDAVELERDLAAIAVQQRDCIIKIIITRGSSARGYRIPQDSAPRRIVSSAPLPEYPPSYYASGVRVQWCSTRLSIQPLLAGIKHLNRLENVLARSEWSDPAVAEGLMCDVDDHVISGTMTNLFVFKDGTLVTPDLSQCGVAGVQRERVLDLARMNGVRSKIRRVSRADVLTAEEVFLVNSVIGVWRVQALDRRAWDAAEMTTEVRSWLERERDG